MELCYIAHLIYLSLVSSGQTNHWKDQESKSQRGLSSNTIHTTGDSGSTCVPGNADMNVLRTSFSFHGIKTLKADQVFGGQNSYNKNQNNRKQKPLQEYGKSSRSPQVTTVSTHLQGSEGKWLISQGLWPFWSTASTSTLKEFFHAISPPVGCLDNAL